MLLLSFWKVCNEKFLKTKKPVNQLVYRLLSKEKDFIF